MSILNGTLQFTFFLAMRLNITIVTSCDYNPCNLISSSLKLENGLKKHFQNVARIKYGFVELVVILFTFGDFFFKKRKKTLETLTSIIRTGSSILVEVIDLVNSVIVFLPHMTLLR